MFLECMCSRAAIICRAYARARISLILPWAHRCDRRSHLARSVTSAINRSVSYTSNSWKQCQSSITANRKFKCRNLDDVGVPQPLHDRDLAVQVLLPVLVIAHQRLEDELDGNLQ